MFNNCVASLHVKVIWTSCKNLKMCFFFFFAWVYGSKAGMHTVYNWKSLRTAITLSWDSSGVKDRHNRSLSVTEFLQLHINWRHFSQKEWELQEKLLRESSWRLLTSLGIQKKHLMWTVLIIMTENIQTKTK